MDAAKTDRNGITHDTASRLIGLTPGELERLVTDGVVRRNDKNSYSVQTLVGEYLAHLRNPDKHHPKQAEAGAHLDLSDRAIRELEPKLSLAPNYSIANIRIAYIRHLREIAAGRQSGADGALDLAQERAALAREQRIGHEIKNQVQRGQYARIDLLSDVLASASQAVTERLEHLPGALKKAVPDLPFAATAKIMEVIAAARNAWVADTAELVSSKVITADDEADEGADYDAGAL